MLNLLQTPAGSQLDSLNLIAKVGAVTELFQTTSAKEVFANFGKDVIEFCGKVLIALAIYILGAWLIKKVRKILHRMFITRGTEKAIASFIESFVSIGLMVLLIIVAVSTLGINTSSLAALLAAGGVAIGMALSGTMQNFAGGIMLLIFKPFKAGDFITAQGFSGTVTEVNIVSTKLTTTDNRVIIIPNGSLSNGTIDNYSQNPVRRLEWLVDVEYGSDSGKVKEVLHSIIAAETRIIDTNTGAPADPLIEINALKDSSVEFIVRAWVEAPDYWNVYWNINSKIYEELPKNGIGFPFPQLDVHLTK